MQTNTTYWQRIVALVSLVFVCVQLLVRARMLKEVRR
jgi:hypothetical protein